MSALLSEPLIIAAGLSQFSAAVADTLAAAANLEEVTRQRLSQRYLLQCMVVLSVCRNHLERVRFIYVVAALVLFLYFLARPDERQ